MKKIVFLLFSIMALLASSTTWAQNKDNSISQKKFERLMKRKNSVVIDVRTPGEYNAGHITGALLMDFQQEDFAGRIKDLDPAKTYLLYCRSGKRSEAAWQMFKKNGFKKVYHLRGGILNWKGKKVTEPSS